MENSSKIIIGLLVTTCILSGITLTMSFMKQGSPFFLISSEERPLDPIILSGEYNEIISLIEMLLFLKVIMYL